MTTELEPEALLRENVKELLKMHGWNQTEFAAKMNRSQSWVSKVLSGQASPKGTRFHLHDLPDLCRVFGRSASELLRPGIGGMDRRRPGSDRRHGERRGRLDPPLNHGHELQEMADRYSPPRPPGGRFLLEFPGAKKPDDQEDDPAPTPPKAIV